MSQKDLFDEEQTESYFKKTDNTYVIDNDEDEIQNEQQDVKRNTIVHQNVDDQGLFKKDNQIYKIEGTEFLPEGFLELDPLLLKDDYDFDNSEDEKLFKKEQAKLVALRRKQYTQKNYKKKRDVVILLLNEKIQAIINYLNDFYQQYKRKMNDIEREDVVNKFNISDQTLLDLEELFLHENGYWDSQGAEEYMLKYAKMKGNFLYVPSEAKELFKQRREEIRRYQQKMEELKKKKNLEKQKKQKLMQKNKSKSNQKQVKSSKQKPMSYFEKMQQRQKEIQNQKKGKSKNKSKKRISRKNSIKSNTSKKSHSSKQNIKKTEIKEQQEIKKEPEIKVELKKEEPKKVQYNIQNFQSFNPNTIKRVSIKQKDIYNNEKSIIILEPQAIGTTIYYQEIHNLCIEGDNQATLITKILDDLIINKYDIPKELQTKGYTNQLFDDDQDPNDPLKKYLIVQNDKKQTVNVQTLRPKVETCQNVDLANQEILMLNNNDIFIRGKEFQHFKERVHTLKPVKIFGQIYQQKVVQLIRGDSEQLKIITVEETGKIILKEELQQQKNTQYFYNKQETELNLEDKNYNIFLGLFDENGEKINQQKFTKILDENQLEFYKQKLNNKRQSMIVQKSGIDNTKRNISLPPFYHQNLLVLPSVEEKKDSVDVVLRNEEGQVITKGQCDVDKKSEFYSIEIINKEIQKNGQMKLTFFLKDAKDNVINVVFLDDLNLIKEDEFQRNVKMIVQKENEIEDFSKNYKEYKSESIILGSIYIYQTLQKPFNLGQKASLITQTEYQDLLSQIYIDNFKNDVQQIKTELLEVINKNEFDEIYRIALKDQDGNVLNIQELQKERIQFLSKRKIQIKDQFVTNQSNEALTKKKEFKAIEFNGKIYNCQIQQILLNDSSKINIFSVKDKKENYHFAQQLKNDQSIDDYGLQTELEEDGLILQLRDHYNNIVLSYKIHTEKKEQNNDIDFNSHISKVYIDYDEKNDTSKLTHYLKSVFVQKFNFCQILEEKIFKKRNRQMIIKTFDHNKNLIDEKMIMKSESFGQNFQTRVNKILNTVDSKNLTTLETINEQKQIISTLNLKIPFKEQNEIIINDQEKEDEYTNEILVRNTMYENIVDIQLLPIFIGDGYFYHIIQKVKTFKNGEFQVFILTFDKFDQMILKEEIYNLEGESFKVKIAKEEKTEDKINVVLHIVNEQNTLIHVQNFKSQLSANLKNYYFTDFFDIYDKNKKKINQVAVQKRSQYTLRFVSLVPILVGNGFLLISVNEILHDKQKQAVVVIKNQKGQLVTFKKVDEKFVAQYYIAKIVQDKIEKDKRIITLNVINDNNEIIATFRLNPFQIQYDDFENQQNLLEMIDEDGKQFFYLLRKNNNNTMQVIDHQRRGTLQEQNQPLKIDFIQRKSILQQIEAQNLFSMKLDQEQLLAIQSRQSNRNNIEQDQQLEQLEEQLPIEDIQSEFSNDQHQDEQSDNEIEQFQIEQKNENDFEKSQNQRQSYKIQSNYKMKNDKKDRKFSQKQNYDYQIKKQSQEDDYQPLHIGDNQHNFSQFFETNFKQSSLQNNLIQELQIENLKNIYLKKSEFQEEQETFEKPNLLQVKNFSFQQNSISKLTETQSEQDNRLKQMIEHIAQINDENEKDKLIYQIQNVIQQNDLDYENTLDQFYEFCQRQLPKDRTYLDGVKMMSLFYFFTQKFNNL